MTQSYEMNRVLVKRDYFMNINSSEDGTVNTDEALSAIPTQLNKCANEVN